ncbi:MAG: 16S rRNA (guanine(527)-N(7))-methyltransferase RsmG [Bacilli bacterium]|nr:16S rRNA (guanine(527)-N(7))-methyltransferase RsmG [Bacilli bacterium]
MNRETFIKELEKLNIKIDEVKLEQLDKYANFLIEYNKHTNLTAITDLNDIYLKHFYDSLTIVRNIDLNKVNNLIDIGTGAGFPGMVLKIVFPHINVTLLDSNNKKTKFLIELSNSLNLDGVNIVNERSEDFARKNLDSYDLVTSRAVTTLPALVELCLPLVKIDGYFISLKGTATEEIKLSSNIIKKLNGTIESIDEFNLPIEESKRTIIKIRKIGTTPKGYPRNYASIKKDVEKMSKIK